MDKISYAENIINPPRIVRRLERRAFCLPPSPGSAINAVRSRLARPSRLPLRILGGYASSFAARELIFNMSNKNGRHSLLVGLGRAFSVGQATTALLSGHSQECPDPKNIFLTSEKLSSTPNELSPRRNLLRTTLHFFRRVKHFFWRLYIFFVESNIFLGNSTFFS